MSPHMTVTHAQVAAAQLQIELAAELGEEVSPAVRAIVQATRLSSPRASMNGKGADASDPESARNGRLGSMRPRHSSAPGAKAVKAAKAPRGARTTPDREELTAIREWARSYGFEVSKRGRPSADPERPATTTGASSNGDDTP